MTTPLSHGTPITHNRHPWLGTGTVVGMIGNTTVVSQWPGVLFTRREAREDVEPYVAPVPVKPVRRRRRAA